MKKSTDEMFYEIYDALYDEENPVDDVMMAFRVAFEFSACVCEELKLPNSHVFAQEIRNISIENIGDVTCK